MVLTATLDLEGPLAVIRFLLMSAPESRDRFVTGRAPSVGTSGLRGLVGDCSGAVAVEAAAKCGAISAAMCASPPQTSAYGASIAGLPGLDASGFLVTTTACGINVTVTYA